MGYRHRRRYYNSSNQNPNYYHRRRNNQYQYNNVDRIVRKSIPQSVRDHLWDRDCIRVNDIPTLNLKCPICCRVIEKKNCHVAHITSLKNGGTDDISNLIYTCAACNQGMGEMHAYEFRDTYYKSEHDS